MSCRPAEHRRGFTLLESLMATGILLVAVVAISMGVTAGQQHALEAHLRIAATIAAEDMMGRLKAMSYSDLEDMDGTEELPGEMTTLHGLSYPDSFNHIGREIIVGESVHVLPGLDVTINGLLVRVTAFDREHRELVTLERFVAQPQAMSIPDVISGDDDDDGGGGGIIQDILNGLGL